MQTSLKEKFKATQQLMIQFPEPEKLENNCMTELPGAIPSSIYEASISLINIEDEISEIATTIHHSSLADHDQRIILTHFWVQLSNMLEELNLLNEFFIKFIRQPEIDLFNFFSDYDEARVKLEKAVI